MVQTSYGYDPYGVTTTTGAANTNSYQYTGRENDGATGFYFYRARYYNPTWGRFISEDPIGLAGGGNLYRYVGDNPLQFRDSLGLMGGGGVAASRSATSPPARCTGSGGCGTICQIGIGVGIVALIVAQAIPGVDVAVDLGLVGAEGAGLAAEGIAGGSQSALAGPALANQLAAESASSAFTAEGVLSDEALTGSREIIPSSQIGNTDVPSGFSKFATQTYQSPSGNFQVHFYMNPETVEPFYGLDYKAVFNSGGVGP